MNESGKWQVEKYSPTSSHVASYNVFHENKRFRALYPQDAAALAAYLNSLEASLAEAKEQWAACSKDWLEEAKRATAAELELAEVKAELASVSASESREWERADFMVKVAEGHLTRAEAAEAESARLKQHGWVPNLLIDHDAPVCEICEGLMEEHESEAMITVAFFEQQAESARLREALVGFVQEARYISDSEFRTSLRAQGISAGDYAAGRLMDLLPDAALALAAVRDGETK